MKISRPHLLRLVPAAALAISIGVSSLAGSIAQAAAYAQPNFTALLLKSIEDNSSKTAFMRRVGKGNWEKLSYAEWLSQARVLAQWMIAEGIQPGDQVGVLDYNNPEWAYVDLACQLVGAVTVPLYPTLTGPQHNWIRSQCDMKIMFVMDRIHMEPLKRLPEAEDLRIVGLFKPEDWPPASKTKCAELGISREEAEQTLNQWPEGTVVLDDILQDPSVSEKASAEIESRYKARQLGDILTVCFTSGTTSEPPDGNPTMVPAGKGVMLTHENILSNVVAIGHSISITSDDIFLSILPLGHMFERTIGYYGMLCNGATVAHARAPATFSEDATEVRPTILAAVPLLWERMYQKAYTMASQEILQEVKEQKVEESKRPPEAVEKAAEEPPPPSPKRPFTKRALSWLAKSIRNTYAVLLTEVGAITTPGEGKIGIGIEFNRLSGIKSSYNERQEQFRDWLVGKMLGKAIGGRVRLAASGGAALKPWLGQFFDERVGFTILEGYGLTETSPVLTVNTLEAYKFGTVGKPIENVQVRLDSESEEIQATGPGIMKGYLKDPERTAASFTEDGWYKTGDKGAFDEDGFLKITGRIKLACKLDNGEYINPEQVEQVLSHGLLDKCMVFCAGEYAAALVFPNLDNMRLEAQMMGISGTDAELCQDDRIVAKYKIILDELQQPISRIQRVQKFLLMPYALTPESGLITPSSKLMRGVIAKRFKAEMEALAH